MNKSHLCIGVDIGGTRIKFVFIDIEGNIVREWEIETDVSCKGKNIVPDLVTSLKENLQDTNIQKGLVLGIGVGAPGFVHVKEGSFYEVPNIGWVNYPLREEIERKLRLRTFVDNDANLAAIGETWRGTAKGVKSVLCVTLGTGVGSGLIINGKIVHGATGMAGEIGHITTVLEDGYMCRCGKEGCLETVASASGVSRLALKRVQQYREGMLYERYMEEGNLTAKDVFDCAKKKDSLSEEVVHIAMKHLGLALGNIANTVNPEMIVIGGGMSQAGDYLLNIVKDYFKEFAIPKISRETSIRLASLGNRAGAIGGAYLVKEGRNR